MRDWIIVIIVFAIIMGIVINIPKCNVEKQPVEKADSTAAPINWEYGSKVDKITGREAYFATCTGQQTIHQKFPYEGETFVYISVRNRNGENDVKVSVTKGQIMHDVMGNKSFRVRFDNEPVYYASYDRSSDLDPTIAFLIYPTPFIAKLKKAKHMVLEIELYNNGQSQIDFDVSGLQWKH